MPGDITVLIAESQRGDQEAQNKLFREIAATLRRIAAVHMRKERQNHTLGIDGVVTDAFMQLINLNRMEFADRDHFFALANRFMKRILENYRIWRDAQKRGGHIEHKYLHDSVISAIPFVSELSDLREALESMKKLHPRQKKALELNYFDGYSQQEVADLLGVGIRTIQNDIRFAKAWLAKEWNEHP